MCMSVLCLHENLCPMHMHSSGKPDVVVESFGSAVPDIPYPFYGCWELNPYT